MSNVKNRIVNVISDYKKATGSPDQPGHPRCCEILLALAIIGILTFKGCSTVEEIHLSFTKCVSFKSTTNHLF